MYLFTYKLFVRTIELLPCEHCKTYTGNENIKMHEYEQKTYVSAPIWKPAIKAMLPFFFFLAS